MNRPMRARVLGLAMVSALPLVLWGVASCTAPEVANLASDKGKAASVADLLDPPAGADQVATDTRVAISFSSPPRTAEADFFSLTDSQGSAVAGKVDWVGRVLHFTPTSPLASNDTHTVLVKKGITFEDGSSLVGDLRWSFRTGKPTAADVVLQRSFPTDGSTQVPPKVSLKLEFSSPLLPATVTGENVVVTDETGTTVAGAVTLEGSTVTFAPSGGGFAPNRAYVATLKTALRSLDGLPLAHEFRLLFQTGKGDVVAPLQVSLTNPLNGSLGVAQDTKMSAVFSVPLDAATVTVPPATGASFQLLDPAGSPVAGSLEVSGGIVTFSPSQLLTRGKTYTALIAKSVKGADGSALPWDYRWSFAVAADESATPITTNRVVGSNPSADAVSVPVEGALTLSFNRAVKPESVTGATVTLKRKSDNQSVAGDLVVVGTQVQFVPLAKLQPGTPYLWAAAGVKDESSGNTIDAWSSEFVTAADRNPPRVVLSIPAPQEVNVPLNAQASITFDEPLLPDSVTAANVVVKDSLGATVSQETGFPALSGQVVTCRFPSGALRPNSLYTVQISRNVKDLWGNALPWEHTFTFQTGSSADGVGSLLTSRFPGEDEFNVAVGSKVLAAFSKSLDATTVNGANVKLRNRQTTVVVPSTLSVLGKSLMLAPNSHLAFDTVYEMSFTGLKDSTGNSIPDGSWIFRTEADATRPVVLAVSPGRDTANVPRSAMPAIYFSKDIDAATVDGTSVTWKDESNADVALAPGYPSVVGNTIYLKAGSTLAGAKTFRLKITSAIKDPAGNALSLPYEWSFTTAEAPPAAPPTPELVIQEPASDSLNVATDAQMMVSFSKNLKASSAANHVTLKIVDDVSSTELDAVVTILGRNLSVTPLGRLSYDRTYTFSLLAGLSFADDTPVTPASWKFHTRPDRDAPIATQLLPGRDAQGLPLNVGVQVWFNEAMDASTLTGATFVVKRSSDGTPVAGTVTPHAFGALFVPSSSLALLTQYTVEVTTGAKDAQGNALAQNIVWTFQTGTAQETEPPTLAYSNPARGAVDVPTNQIIELAFSRMMNVATFTGANVTLKDDQGVAVASTVSTLSPYAISLTPSSPLSFGKRYTVALSKNVKDTLGNPILAAYEWDFWSRLGAGDGNPPGISQVLPASGETEVAVTTEIRALFNEPIDPATVTGASFYVKTAYGNNVAGTVSVTGDNRVVRFVPAANLVAGALYRATLTAAVRDASGVPLPWNQTWAFATANMRDAALPWVTNMGPPMGARYVPINSQVLYLSFSEAMDPTTLVAGTTLKLTDVTVPASPVDVPITARFDEPKTSINFLPVSPLTYGHTYQIRATAGFRDLNGNAMAQDFVSSFSTEQMKASLLMGGAYYNYCAIISGIATGNNVHCWGHMGTLMNEDLWSLKAQFKKVAMSTYNMCGIKADDLVACAGYHYVDSNVANSAQAAVTFSDLAGGYYGNYCGIKKADGSLACWGGWDAANWTAPPAGVGYKKITSGHMHFCAIKSDDTVACWGHMAPLGNGGRNDYGEQTPPPGLAGVKDLIGFHYQNVAVKTDGTLVYWGYSYHGEGTDLAGTTVDTTKIDQVALSTNGVCAITASPAKTVKCFAGWNYNDPWDTESLGTLFPPASIQGKALAIKGAAHDMCAIVDNNNDGLGDDVRCWGHAGHDVTRRWTK